MVCGPVTVFTDLPELPLNITVLIKFFHCLHVSRDQVFETITVK